MKRLEDAMPVTIKLSKETIAALDKYSALHGQRNRSSIMREALCIFLGQNMPKNLDNKHITPSCN